jgi:hypothetical protein
LAIASFSIDKQQSFDVGTYGRRPLQTRVATGSDPCQGRATRYQEQSAAPEGARTREKAFLEHFQVKWIRFAVENAPETKMRADSMSMETAPTGRTETKVETTRRLPPHRAEPR